MTKAQMEKANAIHNDFVENLLAKHFPGGPGAVVDAEAVNAALFLGVLTNLCANFNCTPDDIEFGQVLEAMKRGWNERFPTRQIIMEAVKLPVEELTGVKGRGGDA